jgi:hypothetical protein
MHSKSIENIVNKIITENFSNLEKGQLSRYRRFLGKLTDKTKREPLNTIL